MLRNYLTAALRNFLRHPVYSTINISGLVLGLTCSIFIFLWVLDELSFDRYHHDNDRVFKVMENEFFSDGTISTDQYTPGILAETLRSEFPEVEQACRLRWSDAKLFRAGGKANYEYGSYADKSVFEVLNIPLAEGDLDNALPDNHSVAISKKMASRFFDHPDVLGSTLRMNNMLDLTVTAVFEDVPENSTEKFDFILPADLYIAEDNIDIYKWNNEGWLITIVKLREKGARAQVDKKIRNLIKKNNREFQAELFLFPITEWRLYGHFENGRQAGGRISYVISFSLVALFILLIACINFMNLSTARSANRFREIGVRKAAGASRRALIRQFITESVLLSFFSLFIALLLVHLFLPLFNDFTEKKLTVSYLNPAITGSLLLIALLTGFFAGSYPAFFLSSFRTVSVLKGSARSDFRGASFRKVLVVFQFGLSMIIIVGALVVNDQIAYMQNKDLGFDKKNILFIRTNSQVSQNYEAFRNELLQQPEITSVAMGAANPMEINGSVNLDWEGKPAGDDTYFNVANCDYDYLTTLGFSLVQGRNFSRDFTSDSTSYIVTEGVVKKMGLDNPVGRYLRWGDRKGQIIGVIRDFHNLGIREALHPTVLTLGTSDADFGRWATIFVRYEPGKTAEALKRIRSIYKKHTPDFPIQFSFLDEEFEYQFRTEIMVAALSLSFTVMAVVISCLGLFGLALFNTERRVKEIGIRKVLGASVSGLVVLLCGDFVRLVVYAIVIGTPIAYYLMQKFLDTYTYHTQLGFWMFAVPALFIFFVSLCIVSFQSVKAAMSNPAEVIRME